MTTIQRIPQDVNSEPTRPDRVRVLFIGGLGRSGSTLLDRSLGQLAGFWSMGEVVHLWRRGVLDNERCGCWLPFHECPFWQRVGAIAYGGWDQVDGQQMLALQYAVDRFRYAPAMVRPGLRPKHRSQLEEYRAVMLRLYRAVVEVSGAQLLIDSTKHASSAFLLRGIPDVDLRVVHLVRNSLGVAHSATKRVVKPEVVGGSDYMPMSHPGRVGLRYLAYNLSFDVLRRAGVPTMFVKYEAFVEHPAAVLDAVAAFVDMPLTAESLDFVQEGGLQLGGNHTIAGNPMRFDSGPIQLRVDDRWRTDMARRHQRLVTAVTWPLLVRYGYRSPQHGRDDVPA